MLDGRLGNSDRCRCWRARWAAEDRAAADQLDLAARWADLHPPESIHHAAAFIVPGCKHEEPIAGEVARSWPSSASPSSRRGIERVFYYFSMPRQPPFHVWVDVTGVWSVPVPGVLLAWRRTDRRGWEAWVVRVESYSTGTGSEVLMSQSWVSAALVRPADDSERPGALRHD